MKNTNKRLLSLVITLAAGGVSCAQEELLELSNSQPVSILSVGEQTSARNTRRLASTSLPSAAPVEKVPELNSGELIRQRFPNGNVHVERWVVESSSGDLVNHGDYTQFNEKGEIVSAGQFVLGKRDGIWTQRISSEAVQRLTRATSLPGFQAPFTSKATFDKGQLTGDWTCSDAKGNLLFAWTFQGGKRNGPSTYFNAKGEIVQSINYVDDMADGPAKIVLKQGQAAEDISFEKGRMLRRLDAYYPPTRGNDRKLRSQDWYLVATPYNLVDHDWAANLVQYKEYDKEDRIRHGRSITYYPNGQTESEGQYNRGKRIGTFVWWYSNGQQKTVGEYQEDVEQGDWRWWHANGMREVTGQYVDGEMVAEWSVWNEQGKLVKRSELGTSRTAVVPDKILR